MKFNDAKKRALKMFDSAEFKKRIEDEDNTMLKQLAILRQINSLGFLTLESQAGKKEKGAKSIFDGKPFEIRERAYISGFMREDDAVKFIKNMGIYTDKNAVYVPICSDDIKIPSNLDIPLTITINKEGTQVSTHTSMALPKMAGDFFRKQLKLDKSEKIVYIFCWDSKWLRLASGKDGLFTDIVKILSDL